MTTQDSDEGAHHFWGVLQGRAQALYVKGMESLVDFQGDLAGHQRQGLPFPRKLPQPLMNQSHGLPDMVIPECVLKAPVDGDWCGIQFPTCI